MGLITEKVIVSLSGSNLKYYTDLGYVIPNKNERLTGEKFRQIEVYIEDLSDGSNAKVDCICDGVCGGTILKNISWVDYIKQVKQDGSYYCQNCAMKLYAIKNSKNTRIEKSKSFEYICLDNCFNDVLDRWDYELNKDEFENSINPSQISSVTNKEYYFKCPKNIHPSELKRIANFTLGHDGTMDCKMCNSLGHNYPESIDVWSDKNEKSPFYFSKKTTKLVWWKCPEGKHEDYERTILDSSKTCNFRCPECTQERDESFLQEKVRNYLENIKEYFNNNDIPTELIREYDKNSLLCINPNTKRRLPYDNELINKNFGLIVETHGFQHYNKKSWVGLADNPQKELEYIQWKDQYKMDYALSQGYYYLAIPYWTDNEDEDWQTLIDNKLEEIYNDISQQ